MEPLISVIVPIYKVEAYLRRCVKSIQNQTYSHLEILLVDDGSPDGCGALCDMLAGEDPRISVIHKENGGLSDARNKGLEAAAGEYVAFVDSDDYIAPYFLQLLYEKLAQTGSDVALCSYRAVASDEPFPAPPARPDTDVYGRRELLMNLYDANHPDATYFIVAWNKLYKKSLWDGIRFPKGKIHEDEATTYRIFDRCQRGVYVKLPMYGYFTSESSITRDAFSVRRLEWVDAMDDRIAFFQKKGEAELAACTVRARADGAIHYYYPLDALDKSDADDAAQKGSHGGQSRQGVSESGADHAAEKKRLIDCVRKALSMSREYHNLPFATRLGYRVFCISPGLYRLLNRRA